MMMRGRDKPSWREEGGGGRGGRSSGFSAGAGERVELMSLKAKHGLTPYSICEVETERR